MLSGLILAGGRSSRMGRDKAALTLPDGTTLLERQAALLRAVGATEIFASVRRERNYRLKEIKLVHDALPDAGPMAGLVAGLRATPSGLVAVLAVDMPAVQESHLRQLLALASPERGVVPVADGQCEPLAAIYPSALAASAEAALTGGLGSVHAWARGEAARGRLLLWDAPAEWAPLFKSWNTPADLPRP
jgi:molybdopterin-guanine dinucleotide biosynthesis protein A